jgi:hypothetical protein
MRCWAARSASRRVVEPDWLWSRGLPLLPVTSTPSPQDRAPGGARTRTETAFRAAASPLGYEGGQRHYRCAPRRLPLSLKIANLRGRWRGGWRGSRGLPAHHDVALAV